MLPFVFFRFAQPHEAMGLMMIFFFAVNSAASIGLGIFAGKEFKRSWWIPILFSILFLLSYWLILESIILDLSVYAISYLVLGMGAMLLTKYITQHTKDQ